MANPLYNMLAGMATAQRKQPNIMEQVRQLQANPGAILDILAQSGKINQQQYNDMQRFKNNPQQIVSYLMTHGKANEISQAKQAAGNFNI